MDSKDFARTLLSNQGRIAALLGAVLSGLEAAAHTAQGGNATLLLDEVKAAKADVAAFLADNEKQIAALDPREEGEEEGHEEAEKPPQEQRDGEPATEGQADTGTAQGGNGDAA